MSEIVKVEDLSFRYRINPTPALRNINLSVRAGEFVGITGPAGAGKTTLLSCINGVIPHYYAGERHGRVIVDGLDVAQNNFRELAGHMGTVFEDPDFQMVSITVEEEVAFGPENLGLPPSQIEARICDALDQTHISSLRERAISTLSGGQKQRVAVSSVLSMLPKVLLLDEPTSELDPIGTHELISSLRDLNRQLGITVLMVSQDMERLVENADRILLLSEGRLVLDCPPREFCLQYEVLERAGVRLPQVTEFMISLLSRLNRPLKLDQIPLTVPEAARAVREIMQESGVVGAWQS
jgi:energy-coupling factor transport system ATP-binding protein